MTKSFNLPGLIVGLLLGMLPLTLMANEDYEDQGYADEYQEETYQEEYTEETYEDESPANDGYVEDNYAEDNYEQAAIDPAWEAEAKAYCQEQAEYELPEERSQFIKDCVDSQLQ